MSDLTAKKILILGSRWSGKSLLIKRLEELCSSSSSSSLKTNFDEFIHTSTTIGKTLTLINSKRNHQQLELHELGATVACLWKTSYSNNTFDKLIYVIDATQPCAASFTLEQLQDILEQTTIQTKKILFVINKANEINALSRCALNELLDLESSQMTGIEVMEVNARTGMNLNMLLEWLAR